jgi:hypothetical protein
MDRVEEAAVLDCLRSIHKRLGLNVATDVALELVEIDKKRKKDSEEEIDIKIAQRYINENHIKTPIRKRLSYAALDMISGDVRHVEYYCSRVKSHTHRYIAEILTKNRGIDIRSRPLTNTITNPITNPMLNVSASADIPRGMAHLIFEDWARTTRKGTGSILSGLYQIFRRYKPPFRNQNPNGHDWSDPKNQVMICELVHVDAENMEATLITSEYNIYLGTLH